MTTGLHRRSLSRLAKGSIALEVFLGIGALGGGLVLIVAPRGEIMPLPLSALAGSPFDTYLGPGLILFTVLGIGPFLAARLAGHRHPLAPLAAFAVGMALLIWVAVEIAIIGYSSEPPLQAIYLAMGIAISVIALGWVAETWLPSSAGAPKGSEARAGRPAWRPGRASRLLARISAPSLSTPASSAIDPNRAPWPLNPA